jgi:NADH:ubiquinone oxidoreductase subunit 5 (subunit L)/multisubunit Na+/H+ antiporter MnhA subunit
VEDTDIRQGVTAADHALSELSELTLHRRTRLLQSVSSLPGVFWAVLLAGGVLTVVSTSMFASAKPKMHTFLVFSTTLLITLMMLAIADVDRPFRGWVHVNNYAFVRAQEYMREID